ncbi:CD2 antigen cytoplasmic tail-binding protein 2 homolog [Chenopodium quinoa]|uniref:CD2 antigen cytoplasmic tail-binding protein 2 homolog n=1 Tax=Chenopodium quinoa TaxID=63459 RepID=UPI000B793B35|nr:CD2 antigen cytoplasmic tail-binding protein 2 homolog [Chenopodium quinoa]
MEGPSSSSRKRPFIDEDDDSKNNNQKRVRFPKKKKLKGEAAPEPVAPAEAEVAGPVDLSDPRVAAKERAKRRVHLTTQLFTEDGEVEVAQISAAEVQYQENESFVDDGIQFEPFNLEKEREEGYFDEAGNFVEYVPEKEEKDAWLDSLEVDPKLANRISTIPNNDDEEQEMTSDDIGKIKRRIADVLEPGETVLQALKRLKGTTDKRVKMSIETKRVFDQLTEDAMRLMENGDYNVYHEEREVFVREAEGYEALARARNNVVSGTGGTEDDALDMFADEDDDVAANSEQNNDTSVPSVDTSTQMAVENGNQDSESSWAGQSDYVYDETSGYYYSSSLGYYYDPSTGLFCSASSGQWYKYNEATGTYDEIQPETEAPSNAS